ncbi:HD domain-containing protein [Halobacillus fulvus]|nr:HD domain-containing protein [Halobacillus fulvus]
MDKNKALKDVQHFIQSTFDKDVSGHGYDHMKRVALWSKKIACKEGADPFLAEVTGWLHDVGDEKLFDHPEDAERQLRKLLLDIGLTASAIHEVEDAIASVSFRKGMIPNCLLGKVVQDADRLDAVGAIGIARTFAYGGANQQMIDGEKGDRTSIQHFYDKMLKIKGKMNTDSGREEAHRRHLFMEEFLNQYEREQNTAKN